MKPGDMDQIHTEPDEPEIRSGMDPLTWAILTGLFCFAFGFLGGAFAYDLAVPPCSI